MNKWLAGFTGLFFPTICPACKFRMSDELLLCLNCESHLPETNFHLDVKNAIAKNFWGRVPIEAATALYYYNKGSKVQNLIHQVKYKGNQKLGFFLGQKLGNVLNNSANFNQIDLIVPVPLHPKKFKKRGFNQSSCIANGISAAIYKPVVESSVIRTIFTNTQTRKNRINRWNNVKNVFEVVDVEILTDKNILVVDDVITTGSTLDALIQKMQQQVTAKFYVASLAYAGII